MSGLIDRLISKYCPEGVEYRKLDSGTDERLVKIETGKLDANAAVENGKYMFFTTARQASRTDSYDWDCEALIVAGNANIGDMKHYKGKFNAYQRTYILTNFHRDISPRFLYFVMLNNLKQYLNANKNVGAMTYIVLSTLQNFTIPVPPLPVQKEIVRILDKFSELESELESELKLRKKQFEYYRNKMLTLESENAKRYPVTEVFDFKNGYTPSKSNLEYWENGNVDWFRLEDIRANGHVLSSAIQKVSAKAIKKQLFKANSIMLATTATVGEHALVKIDCLGNDRFIFFAVKDSFKKDINMDYMNYYFYVIDEWCKNHIHQGNFASVDMEALKKLEIPIPPLPVQKEIVRILDKFSTLTNSISEGLPAEIKLGHRRYEYYRDELFKFEKLESETA